MELDIKECAKTVGETISNDTFFDVYDDFDTMLDIINEADLDAAQGAYVFNGMKSRKFSSENMIQIFKSINVHFDSSNQETIDHFFDFIKSAYHALKFRPLKQIYNFINDICNANADLQEEFIKLKDQTKNDLLSENQKLQNDIIQLQQEIVNLQAENSHYSSQNRADNSSDSSIIDAFCAPNFDKIYTMLNYFSFIGKTVVIKIFCKLGLSEVKNQDGCTSLLLACADGNLGLAQSLIEGGCNKYALDKFGNNALYNASYFGKTDVIRYLISTGFDKELKNVSTGSNALIIASTNGHLDTVKYLLSIGCDVNSKQSDNANSCFYAAWNGHLEVLKYLKSYDGLIQWKNTADDNSLHAAARGHNVAVIEYLLSQNMDINGRGWNNFTPLHWAVNEGIIQNVQYLIQRGAKLNEKDKTNKTPLDIAKSKNFIQIIDILINAGAQ